MTAEREPTQDELLAMAYVDDELDPVARKQVERRMAGEPALRREVAELRKLAVIARLTVPPEPMDHEWRALERDWIHAGGSRLGLLLIGLGGAGITLWLFFELLFSEADLVAKLGGGAVLLGILISFLVALRARLRTLPYDPYTEVER